MINKLTTFLVLTVLTISPLMAGNPVQHEMCTLPNNINCTVAIESKPSEDFVKAYSQLSLLLFFIRDQLLYPQAAKDPFTGSLHTFDWICHGDACALQINFSHDPDGYRLAADTHKEQFYNETMSGDFFKALNHINKLSSHRDALVSLPLLTSLALTAVGAPAAMVTAANSLPGLIYTGTDGLRALGLAHTIWSNPGAIQEKARIISALPSSEKEALKSFFAGLYLLSPIRFVGFVGSFIPLAAVSQPLVYARNGAFRGLISYPAIYYGSMYLIGAEGAASTPDTCASAPSTLSSYGTTALSHAIVFVVHLLGAKRVFAKDDGAKHYSYGVFMLSFLLNNLVAQL